MMRSCRVVYLPFLILIGCQVAPDPAQPTSAQPEAGTERGACYGNETCNDGLTCASDLCVRLETAQPGDDVTRSPQSPIETTDAADAGSASTGSQVVPTRPSGDSSFLDPNKVLSRIKSVYMSGLKRCHKAALADDPNSAGKVELRFRIGTTGRVASASVSGFDQEIDACIESLVLGWRFAVPKDENGEPTTADFTLTLALQPDRSDE